MNMYKMASRAKSKKQPRTRLSEEKREEYCFGPQYTKEFTEEQKISKQKRKL